MTANMMRRKCCIACNKKIKGERYVFRFLGILVVLIVAAIFGAGKLPDLRKEAEEKLKLGMAALEKGKEELNKKIAEKTKKDNAAKKTAADENQTGGEEKTDGE